MKRPLFSLGVVAAVVSALFLFFGGLERGAFGKGAFPIEDGANVQIMGTVCAKDDTSFTIRNISFDSNDSNATSGMKKISKRKKCKCDLGENAQVALGSRVVLEATFQEYSAATNPGEFDTRTYYKSVNTWGRLRYVTILSEEKSRIPFGEFLYQLRESGKARLYRIFPETQASVMCALLLGDKSGLDAETKDLYKRNGILHILSISSLHVTILGVGFYKLLRKLKLSGKAASCGGLLFMISYGILTGLGVSVVRAMVMYFLRMAAQLVGRTYDMMNALGAAAVFMLLSWPGNLANSGFLLSYSSILGIGLVAPSLGEMFAIREAPVLYGESRAVRWRRILLSNLRENAMTSLGITLMNLPVQLACYYEFPIFSILINLLVLPLVKPLLLTGFAVLVLPLWGITGIPAMGILGWYEALCGFFDRVPGAVWNPGSPSTVRIVLYYCFLFGGLLLWKKKKKFFKGKKAWWRMGAGGILVVACFVIFLVPKTKSDAVTFLNVGQGDCSIVQTSDGHTFLIDCGSSSRSNVGEYILLPYFKYYGIRRLDAVFVSHPDTDHMNGVLELLESATENRMEIVQLVLPDVGEEEKARDYEELLAAAGDVPMRFLAAGDAFSFGSASFRVLHPTMGWEGENTNAYSLCFYLTFEEGKKKGFSALFTGDVEGEGEEALLAEIQRQGIGDVDVLKVAHHGSKYTTSEEFLKLISPRYCLISCGERNRYGHPHADLLSRVEASGATAFITWQSGAVRF